MVFLNELFKNGKFVILGVGNPDRGDDGIGNLVVSMLKTERKLDCGPMPENYTGKIRKYLPENIIIIDAVDFGGAPGERIVTEAEKATGISLSTHSLPLSLFCKLFPDSKVYLIGIQPGNLDKFSEPVLDAGIKLAVDINAFLMDL